MDHRTQWQRGGRTVDENLDPLCDHDHRTKDEGSWRIEVAPDGAKIWVSPLGCRYPVRHRPVIDDLPGPVPRVQDPWDLGTEYNLGDTHDPAKAEPTWGRQTEQQPPPASTNRTIEFHDNGTTAPQSPRPPPETMELPDTPPF